MSALQFISIALLTLVFMLCIYAIWYDGNEAFKYIATTLLSWWWFAGMIKVFA